TIWLWGCGLFIVSWMAVSLLFVLTAIAALLLWRAFLQWRLGGMSGDCLGAGIEYCECAMLLAACLL
ncbi:MAG: adenosylcobinamide-GDP ribazoletransferase, partial [Mariprofundus sp.]|nr:adenosylcobinamide-GDP ribazoletransferase [Mariprofundus sp.]